MSKRIEDDRQRMIDRYLKACEGANGLTRSVINEFVAAQHVVGQETGLTISRSSAVMNMLITVTVHQAESARVEKDRGEPPDAL